MLNYIFLIFSVLIIAIFFMSVAIVHIRSLKDDLNTRWYNLLDKLQYRQDLLPNLIEAARSAGIAKEELDKLIELRGVETVRSSKTGQEKIIAEQDLSKQIKKVIEAGMKNGELAHSTNFLELKKDISDINQEIEELSKDYNDKVHHFNNIISRPHNKIPAGVIRLKKQVIFEFE